MSEIQFQVDGPPVADSDGDRARGVGRDAERGAGFLERPASQDPHQVDHDVGAERSGPPAMVPFDELARRDATEACGYRGHDRVHAGDPDDDRRRDDPGRCLRLRRLGYVGAQAGQRDRRRPTCLLVAHQEVPQPAD